MLFIQILYRRKSRNTEHIALGDWADAIIVAPATARPIAKLSVGCWRFGDINVASNRDTEIYCACYECVCMKINVFAKY